MNAISRTVSELRRLIGQKVASHLTPLQLAEGDPLRICRWTLSSNTRISGLPASEDGIILRLGSKGGRFSGFSPQECQ